MTLIEEIREITAKEVAKKQDAAKLNFPAIVEKLKKAAALGNSQCVISLSEMNEYDQRLLQSEGFTCTLQDRKLPNEYDSAMLQRAYNPQTKEWLIKW